MLFKSSCLSILIYYLLSFVFPCCMLVLLFSINTGHILCGNLFYIEKYVDVFNFPIEYISSIAVLLAIYKKCFLGIV